MLDGDAELPPEHVRAARRKTPAIPKGKFSATSTNFSKHKSNYMTMAYGWGKHGDVLDSNCTTNQYCDVEGPDPAETYGEAFVKLIPFMIPGGLDKNDMFWVDLNKGVRALYFPARYSYSDDFPNDAAYAKISFVENSGRMLIDASKLIGENTAKKADNYDGLNLAGITRETADKILLNRADHIGAYSFDSTITIYIPQFIGASYWVSIGNSVKGKPIDSIYLAKSADIKATRLPKWDSNRPWSLPPEFYFNVG